MQDKYPSFRVPMIFFHLAICLQSRCWGPGGPFFHEDIGGGPAQHTDGCALERLRACPHKS